MTMLYSHLSPESTTFVGTDAHKLVRYRRNDVKSEVEASLILPKKALSLLNSSLPSEDIAVSIEYNSTSAFFKFGNIHLICRLIDEGYPNYEALIPILNPSKLSIDRVLFLYSLRRVLFYSNKTTA